MNFVRKSKLFRREKMQPLESKDYLKLVVIAGVVIVPLLVGLFV